MGVGNWLRARKERKQKESALAFAKVELNDLKNLRRDIKLLIRAIMRMGSDPKERLFLSVGEIKSIVPRARQIFKELKKIENVEKIEIDELVRLVKGKFKTRETEGLEKELKIEEELRKKILTLEGFFNKMIKHLEETGARKYAYPFFTVAIENIVDAAIKEADVNVENLSEQFRMAA